MTKQAKKTDNQIQDFILKKLKESKKRFKSCTHEWEKLVFKEWFFIFYFRREILVCKKCGEVRP